MTLAAHLVLLPKKQAVVRTISRWFHFEFLLTVFAVFICFIIVFLLAEGERS